MSPGPKKAVTESEYKAKQREKEYQLQRIEDYRTAIRENPDMPWEERRIENEEYYEAQRELAIVVRWLDSHVARSLIETESHMELPSSESSDEPLSKTSKGKSQVTPAKRPEPVSTSGTSSETPSKIPRAKILIKKPRVSGSPSPSRAEDKPSTAKAKGKAREQSPFQRDSDDGSGTDSDSGREEADTKADLLQVFGESNSIVKRIQEVGIGGWLLGESHGDLITGDEAIINAHQDYNQEFFLTGSLSDSKAGSRRSFLMDVRPPIINAIQNLERVNVAPVIAEIALSEMRLSCKSILTMAIGGDRGEAPLLNEIDELGSRGGECLLLISEASILRGTIGRLSTKAADMKEHYGRDVLAVMLIGDPPVKQTFFHIKMGIFVSNSYPCVRIMTTSANWSEPGTGAQMLKKQKARKGLPRITDENITIIPVPTALPPLLYLLSPFLDYIESIVQSHRLILADRPDAIKPTEMSAPHLLRMSSDFNTLSKSFKNTLTNLGVNAATWKRIATSRGYAAAKEDDVAKAAIKAWYDDQNAISPEKRASAALKHGRSTTPTAVAPPESRSSLMAPGGIKMSYHAAGSSNLTPKKKREVAPPAQQMPQADWDAFYQSLGVDVKKKGSFFVPCCSSMIERVPRSRGEGNSAGIRHCSPPWGVTCTMTYDSELMIGQKAWPLSEESRSFSGDTSLDRQQQRYRQLVSRGEGDLIVSWWRSLFAGGGNVVSVKLSREDAVQSLLMFAEERANHPMAPFILTFGNTDHFAKSVARSIPEGFFESKQDYYAPTFTWTLQRPRNQTGTSR